MTWYSPATAASNGNSVASLLQTAGCWCGDRLGAILSALMERDARHRAMCQLDKLDDALLRDIGLTRDDVRRLL